MKFPQVCFFLLASLAGVLCQANFFGYPAYGGLDYFRSGFQQVQLGTRRIENAEERFFLGTRTLTVATSTLTITSTSTTTCTTSTAALSTCVASGGRRRRNAGRGALFHEEHEDNLESVFLPVEKRSVEEPAPEQSPPPEKPATLVPFVIQPGVAGNVNLHPQARFLLALTTSTTTRITTLTVTTSLTAICVSDSSWQLCGSSGK